MNNIEQRVNESKETREKEASRITELWDLATKLSKGSSFSPRSASSIYDELMLAYEIGRSCGYRTREFSDLV